MVTRDRRRAEVERLTAQGWSIPRVAGHLGVNPSTITRDRRAMGIQRRALTYEATRTQRRAEVARLTTRGWSVNRIAAHLEVCRVTINRDRRALSITQTYQSFRETQDLAIGERRAVVRELAQEGLTIREMAARLGVTPRTIERDKWELGITREYRGPLTPAECHRAQAMLDDHESLAEVARTLGRCVQTISERFPGRGWTPHQVGEFNKLITIRKALDV